MAEEREVRLNQLEDLVKSWEGELREGTPQQLIDRLYENCFMVQESARRDAETTGTRVCDVVSKAVSSLLLSAYYDICTTHSDLV